MYSQEHILSECNYDGISSWNVSRVINGNTLTNVNPILNIDSRSNVQDPLFSMVNVGFLDMSSKYTLPTHVEKFENEDEFLSRPLPKVKANLYDFPRIHFQFHELNEISWKISSNGEWVAVFPINSDPGINIQVRITTFANNNSLVKYPLTVLKFYTDHIYKVIVEKRDGIDGITMELMDQNGKIHPFFNGKKRRAMKLIQSLALPAFVNKFTFPNCNNSKSRSAKLCFFFRLTSTVDGKIFQWFSKYFSIVSKIQSRNCQNKIDQ